VNSNENDGKRRDARGAFRFQVKLVGAMKIIFDNLAEAGWMHGVWRVPDEVAVVSDDAGRWHVEHDVASPMTGVSKTILRCDESVTPERASRNGLRALVTAGQGVGNVIMATPAIAAVDAMGFDVDVLLDARYPGTEDLLTNWRAVKNVFTQKPRCAYDAVVRTVGHRAGRIGLGPEFRPDCGDLRATHEVVANVSAARQIGYAGPPPAAHCEIAAPNLRLPERFVVIAPGIGGWLGEEFDRKRWPHWEQLAAEILSRTTLDVVVLGARAERNAWPDSTIEGGALLNLCGRTLLAEAAGIISRAECVIAVDNGLGHVAAALGRPVIALFGPTAETATRPWGFQFRYWRRRPAAGRARVKCGGMHARNAGAWRS
jgi:hypothetical protein